MLREMTIEGKRPLRADLRTRRPNEPRPVVVVLHGFLGYKRWGFFPWLSERIADAGFHVVTPSFGLCGVDEETGRILRPDEFARNTVSDEVEDLHRILGFARDGGLSVPVRPGAAGLVGHSRGGAVAMIAAADHPEVRALVTWATPSTLDRYTERRKRLWKEEGRLVFRDPRADEPLSLSYAYYEDIARHWLEPPLAERAARLEAPQLLVHGEQDATVTLRETKALLDGRVGSTIELEVVPGCGHAFGTTHPMDRPPAPLETAAGLTRNWLSRHLADTERSDRESR
ncbi:MAG: alpha/beta fold hydrolase [Candidatus Krumholzibacteriota bacterium]|nr:alpha/beta fold hydrolase [Candidatus Krumholzibacteriota bacterium]